MSIGYASLCAGMAGGARVTWVRHRSKLSCPCRQQSAVLFIFREVPAAADGVVGLAALWLL